ncbi:hypothetical protein SAMN05421831_10845 [Allopseudospirillum japonicum]|uniref:Uncharacterized protein n=1 Tax=Allopseudospirillum japonicum TaxID=64971 RepID=A0A1H6ST55_9GAMM|nr:hypothetical protein [Allopseudospirillum japonicum]SEI71093.1 hypothetical protein SAMN05421831_10845 [Allopseudospirillum japonicum]
MTVLASQVSDWQHLSFQARRHILDQALQSAALKDAVFYAQVHRLWTHFNQVSATWDQTLVLPGPTGESNELYLTARGLSFIYAEKNAAESLILGQIFASLLCGNSVLCCLPEHKELLQQVEQVLTQAKLPAGVFTPAQVEDLAQALQRPELRLMQAVLTEPTQVIPWCQRLAQGTQVLVPLIYEAYPDGRTLLMPDYLLKLVTERTRTINTTAVGGNATLLELGSRHD